MIVILAGLVTGCQTEAPNATSLSVDFEWTAGDVCSHASPALNIEGIPPETKKLKITLMDLAEPTAGHGGATLNYNGSGVIPAGAFSYLGPCPSNGAHDYRFSVLALDATGNMILARGAATRPFPP
jgi:hypothetical protein